MAATPPRPGSSSLPSSFPLSLAGLKSGAEARFPSNSSSVSLTIDAEIPLGVLSLAVVERDRKAGAARDRQSAAVAPGDRPRGRGRAPSRRRKEKPPSNAAQAGGPRLQGDRLEPRREGARHHGRLAAVRGFQPIDQRVERIAGRCSLRSRILIWRVTRWGQPSALEFRMSQ